MFGLKKYYLLLIPLLLWPLFVLGQAVGQPPAVSPGQRCFDYLKPQSVVIDLKSDQATYRPGEAVKLTGTLANTSAYPIVGGALVLRLNRLYSESVLGPKDIILEQVAPESFNLSGSETQAVNLLFQLPSELANGNYALTFYFVSQNKFNLAGLHSSDNFIGGQTQFTIINGNKKILRLDAANIKVNGQKYVSASPILFSEKTNQVSIQVPLENGRKEKISPQVSVEIYFWDGLDAVNLLKSWAYNVALEPSSTQIVSFKVDTEFRPVYFVKIKAQSGDEQTEAHIRILKKGFRPRLYLAGLTSFPLKADNKNILLACYHNTSDGRDQGRLELELKNGSGKILASSVYKGEISPRIDVLTKDLTDIKNSNKMAVSARLYDQTDKLVDEANIVYDCGAFSQPVCGKFWDRYKWLALGLGGAGLAAVYFIFVRRKKDTDINMS